MAADGESLLARVVSSISQGEPSQDGKNNKSILSQAAASYARKPTGAEATIPTGFDPRAASLFEAVVEAAFLVANADGEFDEAERETFVKVVHESCSNTVQRQDVHSLVADLADLLDEDGMDRRLEMVSSVVQVPEHKLEVLRIAALMAWVSGGVDITERTVIEKLAGQFGLSENDIETTFEQARTALGE